MEWDALIECGKARLRVKFEGGSSSGFGESPALYRTKNPAAQHIIEMSQYFKEKRIRLIRVIHYADGDAGDTSAATSNGSTAGKGTLILEDKSFSDMQTARRYMHETYGVALRKMLSQDQIRQAGELYGIRLSWDR